MKLSRRDFLTFTGFTLVGVAGGRFLQNQIMPAEKYYLDSDFRQRQVKYHTGICGMCPAGCGIRVRWADGTPVKVDGNPLCPVSRGRLCPKGQMGLELHYNPDRLAGPLQRVGQPGNQKWRSLSWDQALQLLGEPFRRAYEGKGNGRICILSGDEHSLSSHLWQSLAARRPEAFRIVRVNALRDAAARHALQLTAGQNRWPVYDIEHADLLAVFDTPLLSGWASPTYLTGQYARFRRRRPRHRGRMLFCGSRDGLEATSADRYERITPYSGAVLALGIAETLIRENRFDREAVDTKTRGFEELKRYLLKYFHPRSVTEITGLPEQQIIALAREFATSPRPLVLGERIPERSKTWEQAAYLGLNALAGNMDVEGGLMLQEAPVLENMQPPSVLPVDPHHPDRFPLDDLLHDILDGHEVPELLLVDKTNPAAFTVMSGSWAEALSRIPFVVSFSPYPDFTSNHADLILPDLDFLEKSRELFHPPATGMPSISVTEAAAPSVVDGMDTRLVQLLLADDRFVSGGIFDLREAGNALTRLRTGFRRDLYRLERGMVYDTRFTRQWVRQMESGGWWSTTFKDFKAFDAQIAQSGGWLDPHVRPERSTNRILGGNNRFNFKAVVDLLPLERIFGRETIALLPERKDRWWSVTAWPAQLLALGALPYGNVPHLLEFPQPGLISGWEPWLELHPALARKVDVSESDRVHIRSGSDERTCRVQLNERLHPDVAAVPWAMFGLGQGRWILDNMQEPLQGPGTNEQAGTPGVRLLIRKV